MHRMKRNVKDLVDVPKKVLEQLKIVPITHMDEVLQQALYPAIEKPARFSKSKSQKEKTKESGSDDGG